MLPRMNSLSTFEQHGSHNRKFKTYQMAFNFSHKTKKGKDEALPCYFTYLSLFCSIHCAETPQDAQVQERAVFIPLLV